MATGTRDLRGVGMRVKTVRGWRVGMRVKTVRGWGGGKVKQNGGGEKKKK